MYVSRCVCTRNVQNDCWGKFMRFFPYFLFAFSKTILSVVKLRMDCFCASFTMQLKELVIRRAGGKVIKSQLSLK